MLNDLAYVAVGGALGALLRYGAGLGAARWMGTQFPYGILAVNLVGCLLIGLLAGMVEGRETRLSLALEAAHESERLAHMLRNDSLLKLVRLGLMIGFLGGLTTFSSFGLDTLKLVEARRFEVALANVGGNVLFGLVAVWAGLWLARAISLAR
jgi:CrcB protein